MKIRNRAVNWAIAVIVYGMLKLLFLTTRLDHRAVVEGATTMQRPRDSRRYCFCMWHDAILLALFARRSYFLAGLISRHQDGTYLSYLARILGIRPVRGSTSRGAAVATRQLLQMPDRHICITPDGPRGPRRRMKDGIIYIASRTGRPVVPSALKATRCWRIPGGWSDMLIPKPFSRILVLAGRPIHLPPDLNREEIAHVMERLQDEMDRLDAISDRIVQGDESAASLIANDQTTNGQTALPDVRRAA